MSELSLMSVAFELGEAIAKVEKLAIEQPLEAAGISAFAVNALQARVPGIAEQLEWIDSLFPTIAVVDANGCIPQCAAERVERDTQHANISAGTTWNGDGGSA